MSPAPAATVAAVRRPALVHAPWTAAWYGGRAELAAIFGAPPSLASLRASAEAQTRHARWKWPASIRFAPGHAPPADALVVLAGQQPVLAGGPALVAHKAATAVHLAHVLADALQRPVVPVFLLADEDHDTSEVDHVDVIEPGSGRLRRHRCPVAPRAARFAEAHWDAALLDRSVRDVAGLSASHQGEFNARHASLAAAPVDAHVASLMLDVFGEMGLVCLRASELTAAAPGVLAAALADGRWAQGVLAAGAERMGRAGLPVSFDPQDRRPLALESRDARRRRIAEADGEAVARQRARPDTFSPHAALRPVVQAAALPVVAQVAGPSELLYLGQARGLHERFGLAPPVLVPRLEATRVTPAQLRTLGVELGGLNLHDARQNQDFAQEWGAFAAAAAQLADAVAREAPVLLPRAQRWRVAAERAARKLAEAPHWHGGGGGAWSALRPRGRPQDTVLAWLPDAWRAGRPGAWGRRLVALSHPLDPPEHVLHLLPEETSPKEPLHG